MTPPNDIETLLRAAAPKPTRPLSSGFTPKIMRKLNRDDSPTSVFAMFRMLFSAKLVPATMSLALIVSVLTVGAVYATVNGWPSITALFSGETPEAGGTRIVKVDTTNCASLYVPLAFQHANSGKQASASHYFRVKKSSKLTNNEIVRMVRGYCELGQQTIFDQTTILPKLEKMGSSKNAQIFGLFASSTVERIDKNSIDVIADIPTDNSVIKRTRFSFKAIDSEVLVYDIDRKIRLADIHVGDNVALKYRVPRSNTSQELSSTKVSTGKKTVVAITKNPPNIIAALDYEKYKNDLIEVIPCSKDPTGYCTPTEFAQ